ncbi:MAG: hypothetical protein K2Y39_19385 [Candidatus Obscuribacterales bacterium]|nr:hypothetical protein [Candidatus Obscuribacterales bacterium]
MDLIFEGRLSDQIAMKDVLVRIKTVPVPGLKILRINRQRDGLNGKIAIDGGRYVTAASVVDSVETGYTALRLLLSVDEGNFALLNAKHGDSIELQPNLHIEIDQLIQTMPHLPDNPSRLFDERALLDKVFGQDFTLSELPALPEEKQDEQIPPPMVVSGTHKIPDKAAWALMQPLIDNESFPPGMVKREDVENVVQSRNPRKTLTGSPALRQSEYLSKDKVNSLNLPVPVLATAIILLLVLAIGVALYLFK